MLMSAMTIGAGTDIEGVLRRLEPHQDDDYVIIYRQTGFETYWYWFSVDTLRSRLRSARERPDAASLTLSDVLVLREPDAEPTLQISESSPDELESSAGILLDGDVALGVLVPASVARGDSGGAASFEPGSGPFEQLEPEQPEEPAANGAAATFTAFPSLDAPASVAPGEAFDLVIGLSDRATDDTGSDDALTVTLRPADREEFDLVVQVIARGFTAPEGVRRFLHVHRDAFGQARETVRLVADDTTEDVVSARLIVEYSYEGNLCGRAWREVRVAKPHVSMPDVAVLQGASGITTPPPDEAPDLTVSVTGGERDGELIWTFMPGPRVDRPDDRIPLPEGQVTSSLGNREVARDFAERIMKEIPEQDGDEMVVLTLLGAGREVSSAMPAELWSMLETVWARARQDGRTPTLLLVSSDPYVPWELASVESEFITDQGLLDAKRPPFLAAQLCMGRWIHRREGSRARWPLLPPSSQVDVAQMVVVVGDYLALNGQRPLPKALEEGRKLQALHRAVRLTATAGDVVRLLENRVELDGEPLAIDAIHFACHGEVDLRNPMYNGIVLSERQQRLDDFVIRGSRIGDATQPFIFVNACQLGTATYTLGDYGGLASAFLRVGFRAFVAPLWSVDDQIAQDAALDFYRRAFDERAPVAEALREVRAAFAIDPGGAAPPSSYLAYVFYGHPNLRLHKVS
jgi:hypothetical protein